MFCNDCICALVNKIDIKLILDIEKKSMIPFLKKLESKILKFPSYMVRNHVGKWRHIGPFKDAYTDFTW